MSRVFEKKKGEENMSVPIVKIGTAELDQLEMLIHSLYVQYKHEMGDSDHAAFVQMARFIDSKLSKNTEKNSQLPEKS